MRKYRNQPVEIDGHRFASKAEARRYGELKLLERANQIAHLELQPRFPLHVREVLVCTYVADFAYMLQGRGIVEDVKSPATRTPQYRIKVKLLRALTGIEVREVA